MSLQKFLSTIKTSSWKEMAKSNVLKVVMGNEACDLDSVVSSIVYAYLLQALDKEMKFGAVSPVLNIERKEFPLRTEVKHWLQKHSISEQMLTFKDDVDLSNVANEGNLHLYLVDHNILSPCDGCLEPCVVFVLDHHQLERTDTPVYGMTVEPVGSCATLVAAEIMSKEPTLLDTDVTSLLYGTILLDTVCLSEAAQKATPKDVEVVEYLENIAKLDETQRQAVYEELSCARQDVTHLNSEQIFRKDLKVVSANNICVAISSVPMAVQEYLKRDNIESTLRHLAETFNYEMIVLVCWDVALVERSLAIFSHRKQLRTELSAYLASGRGGILQLEAMEDSSHKDCNTFHQRNHVASRKVVLPLVKEWLNTKM